MYARVSPIRFPPIHEDGGGGRCPGLVAVLRRHQGYKNVDVLTDAEAGEGLIISYWETEADAEASEANPSYIGQMSMMSSFLRERLTPKTYEANVRA